jgi:hypothetical protein
MLLTTGCVTHRGPWWRSDDPAPPPDAAGDGVALVLLSNLAPEDRGAREVARRVEGVLATDRPHVVLWLGNVAAAPMTSATMRAQRRGPRCASVDDAWAEPAAKALAEAIDRLGRDRSFAVPGTLDHRCGHSAALREGQPWTVPGSHYVLRLYADGTVAPYVACRHGGCVVDRSSRLEGEPPPLVDLVVVDLAPWVRPYDVVLDEAPEARALESLLAAISSSSSEAPPRLLVSNVPIEAAGEHGLGALWPEATFHGLPAPLRAMLVQGAFAGVLAGDDRSIYATDDLTDAIKRADRAWLRAPVFQAVAGAVSRPNDRASMALRPRRLRTSQTHAPPIWSDHRGFVVVDVHASEATLTLHAWRHAHWETASLTVPLRPPPHPVRSPSPHMAPCRDCPPIPASER